MAGKKFSVLSSVVIFVISLYFATFLNQAFWRYMADKTSFDNLADALFALSLPFFIFVPLYLLFNLIVFPNSKAVIVFLLICSAAANYAMSELGVVISSDMFRNLMETNRREMWDLMTWSAALHISLFGVLPAVLLMLTHIRYAPLPKEICRRLWQCLGAVGIFVLFAAGVYKHYVSFGRNNSMARRYLNTFNYISAAIRYGKTSLNANRTFEVLDASPQRDKHTSAPRLLIVVAGETARAANFSLYGYAKETNPRLAKQDIVVFADAVSCGTSTAVALPCVFSALPRRSFNVNKEPFRQNLLDIARSAGYDVWWKENDDGCKKICNRVNVIDVQAENKKPHCFGSYCHDEALLEGLEEQIGQISRDTMIVLHTMGSHGPTYYKRYPDKFKHFKPACNTASLQDCSREQIVNSYDNTIRYTDYILARVIEILKKYPQFESAMLYFSDHGESLGENSIYLHGLPYNIAPEHQIRIPLILWMSHKLRNAMELNLECLTKRARNDGFSHDNIFHSVLRLLSIQSKLYNPELDWFDGCLKMQNAN